MRKRRKRRRCAVTTLHMLYYHTHTYTHIHTHTHTHTRTTVVVPIIIFPRQGCHRRRPGHPLPPSLLLSLSLPPSDHPPHPPRRARPCPLTHPHTLLGGRGREREKSQLHAWHSPLHARARVHTHTHTHTHTQCETFLALDKKRQKSIAEDLDRTPGMCTYTHNSYNSYKHATHVPLSLSLWLCIHPTALLDLSICLSLHPSAPFYPPASARAGTGKLSEK